MWQLDGASERTQYVEVELFEAQKVVRALESSLRSKLKDNYAEILAMAPFCYLVHANGKWLTVYPPKWSKLLKGNQSDE